MKYYYVKSGGTATGTSAGYESPKTGSWSTAFTDNSQYYDNINYFLLGSTLYYDDVVFISNAHNRTGVSTSSYSSRYAYEGCKFISVSDLDITVPSVGAYESWTTGLINFAGDGLYFYGISLTVPSLHFYTSSKQLAINIWENCTLSSVIFGTINTSADYYSLHEFRNCTITSNIMAKEGQIILLGCTIGSVTSSPVFPLNGGTWDYRDPVDLYAIGCNLTQVTAAPLFYHKPYTLSDTEFHYYPINCIVDRCSLSNSAWPPNTNWDRFGNSSVATPIANYLCGNDTGKYFFEEYRHGRIYSITSVYRSGGARFRNTLTPYSIYSKTSQFISITPQYGAQVFRFKLADLVADFTEYLEFKIEIAQPNSSTLLHGGEVWAELIYPDDTGTESHFISTKEFKVSGHTAYPYSGSTWVGLTGPVLQTISITTTELGIKGLCSIWINILPKLREIYFCPFVKTVKV